MKLKSDDEAQREIAVVADSLHELMEYCVHSGRPMLAGMIGACICVMAESANYFRRGNHGQL